MAAVHDSGFSDSSVPFKVGRWTVTPALNQLDDNADSVKIEPRAMDLLVYLVNARARVVSADELLRGVWHGRAFDDGVVYRKINQLRKILGDDPSSPRFIETIPKRGYRLIAAVDVIPASRATETARTAPVGPLDEPPLAALTRSRWVMLAGTALVAIAALSAFALWKRNDEPARLSVAGPIVTVTTEPGDETEPSLSPDGTRVAFVRETGDGRAGIFWTELGSTERVPLTPKGQGIERSPRWSPIKPEIAFLRQQGPTEFDLMLVSAVGGGNERKLATLQVPVLVTMDSSALIAWTADGRLVFNTASDAGAPFNENALYALSTETEAMERLGDVTEHYDASPAVSPDGKRLAFVRYNRNQPGSQLLVQDLGPEPNVRATPQPVAGVTAAGLPRSPVWSADSKSLTFIVGREVYEWSVGGTARVIYSTPLASWGFDIQWRDGQARAVMALASPNLDIWSLPLDPVTHVAPGGLDSAAPRIASTAGERGQRFSPDGRRLAFVSAMSGSDQLWLSNADGSAPVQLTDLSGLMRPSIRWSPDGARIAFTVLDTNRDLSTYVIDVETGTPKPLFKGYLTDWSRQDSQYLYAFRLGVPEIALRVRVADGAIEDLFQGGGVESADGSAFLYSKNNLLGIFARSTAGTLASNPEQQLVEDYFPARGDIVPVADGFYYVRHVGGAPRAFGFYDYATRKAHDVAAAPKSINIGMDVSPDGTELLYSANAPGSDFDLMAIEFDAR